MTRRHRGLARCLVILSGLVAFAPLLAWPAGAATSAPAAPAVEAWYRTPAVGGDQDPLCATPAGCPFAPAPLPPPYPEDTLHVGATSGRADSVTYLALDTSALPSGATLTGGTAILPVASAEDGSFAADTAELRACLLTEPFEPAQGAAVDEAPEPDCSVTAPATYVAEGATPHFEIDLAAFLAGWSTPGAIAGLVLTPEDGATGTWHVAFSGREREQEGAAPPITATLAYETTQADDTEPDFGSSLFTDDTSTTSGDQGAASGSPSSSPPFSTGFGSAPPVSPTAPAVETDGSDEQPAVAPAPAAEQPVAAPMVPANYPSYPVVWLLPLVLAFGGITLTRTLTGEVEVLTGEDEPDLIGRLWLAFFPDRQPAP